MFFSWDKIFYIYKKAGNNPCNYFILQRHESCLIHNSTTCGCKLNIPDNEKFIVFNKRIEIYNICSTFIEIVNKKITYVKAMYKIQLLEMKIKE